MPMAPMPSNAARARDEEWGMVGEEGEEIGLRPLACAHCFFLPPSGSPKR